MFPAILVGIIIALMVCFMVWKMSRRRLLSGSDLKRVRDAWNHVQQTREPSLQILEADKVLDLALTKLGYTGSLGEKLKKAGPRFRDINAVWSAHKLRNTLAHEVKAAPQSDQVERALRAFRTALGDLGMK